VGSAKGLASARLLLAIFTAKDSRGTDFWRVDESHGAHKSIHKSIAQEVGTV
jgi:hypothetical protein